jgi:hypothetical protein
MSRQQSVKLATQLLSGTVNKGILYCESQKTIQSPSASDTAKFVKLVDMWFYIYNSRMCFDKFQMSRNAYGTNSMEQDGILNEVYAFAKNARSKGKHSLLPFQNGIMVSVNSLKSLYADLKEKYGFRYILTYRINQDVLENFFSFVRSMGRTYDHPSPVDVKYRLCLYSLGKSTGNVTMPIHCKILTSA